MKAFLTALSFFVLTVVGCHFYTHQRIAVNNPAFSTWPLEEKGTSFTGLTENMNAGSMPVFGSSEFQHGRDTIYHPSNMFAGTDFNPMLIGAGYYQCLSHSITLAAIEPSMQVRKAALIVSPQWFRRPGVLSQAYTSRFSEGLYAQMLSNPDLSDETKEYISERTHTLLSEMDEKTLEHVDLHEKVLWKSEGSSMENFRESFWTSFLLEKDYFTMASHMISAGIRKGIGVPEGDVAANAVPDFEAYLEEALKDGDMHNQNELFIDEKSYEKLLPYLPSKKGMNSDAVTGYQKSPEYKDLRCFLTVCGELGIDPMIILIPCNGYYYDYTEFPKEARQGYYAKVRAVAEEFGAAIADFTGEEYTRYFFEDRVHIGKTGWVMVNESLYEFYNKNNN